MSRNDRRPDVGIRRRSARCGALPPPQCGLLDPRRCIFPFACNRDMR